MNNLNEIREKWRNVCDLKARMERKVLALMSHPDATEPQIMECHRAYVHVCAMHRAVRDKLRCEYPHHAYAWNRTEA